MGQPIQLTGEWSGIEDREQKQTSGSDAMGYPGRMSFREITMQDVREVLRRRQAGQSARRIARETGLDRKTVGRYLEQAVAGGVTAAVAVTEVGGPKGMVSMPTCRRWAFGVVEPSRQARIRRRNEDAQRANGSSIFRMALHPEVFGPSDLPPIGTTYEREHLDFKSQPTSDAYEVAKDVAAFANRTGGVIIVGAREENDRLVEYRPLPQSVADTARISYLNATRDLCVPTPTCDVHVIPCHPGFVVAANVRALPDQVVGVRRKNDPNAYAFPQRIHSGTTYLRPTELATVMIPESRFAALQLDSIPSVERDKIILGWIHPSRASGSARCRLHRIEAENARAIFVEDDVRPKPGINLPLKAIAAVLPIGDGHWRVELYGSLTQIGQGLVWQPAR